MGRKRPLLSVRFWPFAALHERPLWVVSGDSRMAATDPKRPVESGSNRLTADIQLNSSPATSLLALDIPHSSNAESTYFKWLGIF